MDTDPRITLDGLPGGMTPAEIMENMMALAQEMQLAGPDPYVVARQVYVKTVCQ
jgi:hypothetical protein